jgi:probable rRNA maturation factor
MVHGSPAPDALQSGIELSLANEQSRHAVDERRLLDAARRVLADSRLESAKVSLAVVDDPTIHALNVRFLHHDWPTDVLSFALGGGESRLKGEVVLSADTAARVAAEGGWDAADEQLLYVIHGTLHLVGLDDQSGTDAARMRAAENYYLQECGVALEGIARRAATDGRAGAGGSGTW